MEKSGTAQSCSSCLAVENGPNSPPRGGLVENCHRMGSILVCH